ncbi:MAG: hypothetical protein B7Y02_06885 [Rhodobacterales bacterium 17-64-5]|nr:MAG: hypothetical protein B7Y02_06885 [Rhodobacterales bacterium 17-64-5]
MSDFCMALSNLRRPRLLMHAARFGLGDYRRDRDLRRLVNGSLSPDKTVPSLMILEADIEASRTAGETSYSAARHIDVLVALLAEARLLRRGLA